jgi:hypothetical protein
MGSAAYNLCEFRAKHPRVEAAVESLKHDVDELKELRGELVGVIDRLGKLEGRLAGYLVAATVLGTCVAFIAQHALK